MLVYLSINHSSNLLSFYIIPETFSLFSKELNLSLHYFPAAAFSANLFQKFVIYYIYFLYLHALLFFFLKLNTSFPLDL